jgi:hypothetical protein
MAADEALGRQFEAHKAAAWTALQHARGARRFGNANAAARHLVEAASYRGQAQEAAGIKPSPRVFQRPSLFQFGDTPAARRLP